MVRGEARLHSHASSSFSLSSSVELESTLMMLPEDKISEGEDVENKEDNISRDSGGSSNNYGTNLSLYRNRKRWYRVGLLEMNDRDEQVALLLDMLKCDKSELCSIYRYCSICLFQAYMTYAEAQKFRALAEVKYVAMVSPSDDVQSAKRIMSGIFKVRPKSKKQKLSLGSILSEWRQNKEKWTYNEDLELKDSEEEEFSEDECSYDFSGFSDDKYDSYFHFDEFGKRWYKVCLVDDKTEDDQVALLLDMLKCDQSEIRSIYK
ncbi:PREDICTED: uncharacterized protein LOC18587104 [Theobroma cacao]|uniref:Uncharacterized protein LOC18587104 n=1 Tax=Theobroma cacao TaxID=3641 RepID=A0AB32WYT2_THECC|nr:PREDICTED: uncharacterized protein LOC18587104 [Theobroma cacao]